MSDHYIIDSDGNIVPEPDMLKWGEWYSSADRQVARSRVGVSLISTVFLGLDHAFGGGPPLLYETMVFEGPLSDEQCRYHTREGALAGHEAMVERVRVLMLGPEWLSEYHAELASRK